MADLSEKLGLESAGGVVYEVVLEDHNGSRERSIQAVEADRRATVEEVARWLERLCPGCRCPHADDIRRELLAPHSPGEGREPGGRDGE